MTYLTNLKQKGEIAATLTIGALILMVLGTFFGARLALQPQSTSSFAAGSIRTEPNNDVDVTFSGPRPDRVWDYILSGNLCFNFTPPTTNSQYRVEILSGSEVIGASVYQPISVVQAARCGGSGLTFTAPFNLPSSNSCPNLTVRVNTRGAWPRFKPDLATIGADFFCDNPASPTPIPPTLRILTPAPNETIGPSRIISPTVRPLTPPRFIPASPAISRTVITAIPTQINRSGINITPVPAIERNRGVSGTISIYSCSTPANLTLRYCDDENGQTCSTLSLQDGPSGQGIWLDDTTADRTSVYRYKISNKASGTALGQNDHVYIKGASGVFSDQTVRSTGENNEKVNFGQTLDLSIMAESQTCSCSFQSTAYVKTPGGQAIRKYDLGLPQWGLASDKQRAHRGDVAAIGFINGQYVSPLTDLNRADAPESYGRDHTATIKLYHDNSRIEKLVCDSTAGNVPACPEESWQWEANRGELADMKVFPGLRVTCDANLSYGWIIDTSVLSLSGLEIPLASLDLNGDKIINTIDYQLVIDVYQSREANQEEDFDKNGRVDAVDLSLIIDHVGESVE